MNNSNQTMGKEGLFSCQGRLVVIAHGISPLGTMGGNSKIILEILKNLPANLRALVVTFKPETFEANGITNSDQITIAAIPKPKHDDWLHTIQTTRHTLLHTRECFTHYSVGADDIVYCVSDFPLDAVPGGLLKKEFGYRWIPSFFLFVPSLFQNIRQNLKFPIIPYIIYYVEQWLMFLWMKRNADGFVITNETDCVRFSEKWQSRILAIYGGVNVEQIEAALKEPPHEKTYDAVFCSRLHPQKGISKLLDTWKLVVEKDSSAQLAIIGNGYPKYEEMLCRKATRLGIDKNVEWLGYVNNKSKYQIYNASKMLLHATIFDNNGMVAAEALCTGLPVVMYDLPSFKTLYTKGCVKVPERDIRKYADAVVKLLQNDVWYESIRPTTDEVKELRKHWAWEHRTDLFIDFLERMP